MSIKHVGIVVQDLDKMIKFYKLLGFEEYVSDEVNGDLIDELLGWRNINVKTVKLKSLKDGSIIELLKYNDFYSSNSKMICSQGLSHIAINVDNIDIVYNDLKDLVVFVSPPLLTKDNVKVCFCRDVEGNFCELVELLKE